MSKKAFTIVVVLLVSLYALFLIPKIAQLEKLKSQSRQLETELGKLHKHIDRLETELRLLREDPVYLEKVAREKLNKVKPGEIVYELVDINGEPILKQKKDS